MTDIVEEKPEHQRSAEVKGDELHMTDTLGPQQLIMQPGQPAIGQRHTTTLDIVKFEDTERFMANVRQQIAEIQENLVKQNEQRVVAENMGIQDVGPQLDTIVTDVQKICDMQTGSKKNTAWQKFQRKLFKPVEKGKKGNALLMAFNNWQAYKQLMSQIELNDKRLVSAQESLVILEEALAANGTPSP